MDKLKLNTENCCFLCLNVMTAGKEVEEKSVKSLLSYLKINWQSITGNSSLGEGTTNGDILVDLCDNCGNSTRILMELLQKIEAIQMQVDYMVGRTYDKIAKSYEDKKNFQIYSQRMTSNPVVLTQLLVVDKLRKEIKTKSKSYKRSYPQIQIQVEKLKHFRTRNESFCETDNSMQTPIPSTCPSVIESSIVDSSQMVQIKMEVFEDMEVSSPPPGYNNCSPTQSPSSSPLPPSHEHMDEVSSPPSCHNSSGGGEMHPSSSSPLLPSSPEQDTSAVPLNESPLSPQTSIAKVTKVIKQDPQSPKASSSSSSYRPDLSAPSSPEPEDTKVKTDRLRKRLPLNRLQKYRQLTVKREVKTNLNPSDQGNNDNGADPSPSSKKIKGKPGIYKNCTRIGKKRGPYKKRASSSLPNTKYNFNEETNRYRCRECSKEYKNSSNLRAHIKSVHIQIRYPCDICNNYFTHIGSLYRHRINCKGIQPKKKVDDREKYSCEICFKEFLHSPNLDRHINTVHLNLRPYECDQCDKKFNSASNLLQHKDGVHLKLTFNCTFCNLRCDNRWYYNKHVKDCSAKPKEQEERESIEDK